MTELSTSHRWTCFFFLSSSHLVHSCASSGEEDEGRDVVALTVHSKMETSSSSSYPRQSHHGGQCSSSSYVEQCRRESKHQSEALATKQDHVQQHAVQTSDKADVERELGLIHQEFTRRCKVGEEAMRVINAGCADFEQALRGFNLLSIQSAASGICEMYKAATATTADLFSLVARLQLDVETLVCNRLVPYFFFLLL